MDSTNRLYFNDSDLLDFSATAVSITPSEAGDLVVLDRTAFYPTGGGQPNDTGILGDVRVLDVNEDEAGVIHHLLAEKGRVAAGDSVQCKVDFERRRDHLQQHSGQHILSQAFVRACGAQTRSFHLGAISSTIDIELDAPTPEAMRAAEEAANAIIFEDRSMRVHYLEEAEAARLPLRKESAVKGTIRVIEIDDFDWSPCGGTHASSTGRIGLIAIKSFERAKRMTRVEFVCGHRALEEYRRTSQITTAVAAQLSASAEATPELVARSIQENKALKRRIRDLLELATKAEAVELLAQSKASTDGFKLVQAVFDERDADELRMLASKIVQAEPAVALLGTRNEGSARLVFARSEALTPNMGKLLAEACELLGGRGGGKPELAQGGGPGGDKLGAAIEMAARRLSSG
jgi:alanyl-tRNA synthetase